MKTLIVIAVSFLSLNASAEKRGLLTRCSNAQLQVSVFEDGGRARASVTFEDGATVFKNLKISYAKMRGGPVVYHSPAFMLVKSTKSQSATLSVPSLDLKNEKLKCINVL